MRLLSVVVVTYAILLILGGIIGFLHANSLPSLIAGTIFGVLMLLCGYGILQRSVRAAYWAFAFSLILLVFFGIRYYNSLKIMPAGIMGLLSLVVCILLLVLRKRITHQEDRP